MCCGLFLYLWWLSICQKYTKNTYFVPPETEIINLVPEYYAETSSMTIYVHIWLILICEHAFCPVLGFMVISRAWNVVKNMPIMPILAPWILNIQYGASILFKTSSMTIYGHIWLKLIFQHAFLTCYRIYDDFQDKKSVKNMSKTLVLPPLNLEYPIWWLYIITRHLLWISMVIYDWN